MIITDITSEKKEKQIQRLAAYCRVSSDSEDQLHSFAAQVCYYANYEKQHPNVELVGIYADEGLSGTSLKNRTELQRLIQDCEHGKVDRVITKSVSRFARNTHDLLQTVRLLKSLGVTVLFEEQGIDTAKLNSEMFLTFPGMIAQQESESISGNMRWSYKKRMESGEFNTCKPAFGFELVNGELVVNKEEAKVIRRIFNYYLQGLGKQRIAELLNNEGVPTKYGDKKWYHTAIHYVLNNERYMGDALLQKKFTTETLPFKLVLNHGEKPQYYVEKSNPSIISKDIYDMAQRLQKDRLVQRNKRNNHLLTQTIFCPICNRSFRKIKTNGKHYWISSGIENTECNCIHFRVKETAVFETFAIMTLKLIDNREDIIETALKQFNLLQHLYSDNQDLIEKIDSEIAQLSVQNHVLTKLYNSGILNSADFSMKSSGVSNRITELRLSRRKILSENKNDELIEEICELNMILSNNVPQAEFDVELFRAIVKRIDVINNSQIKFKLLGDLELTEIINEKWRCKSRE